jgi:hypothetical protein
MAASVLRDEQASLPESLSRQDSSNVFPGRTTTLMACSSPTGERFSIRYRTENQIDVLIMGWKKMLVGEKMPDKDDPKYRQRYEEEVKAGRKFARTLKLDVLAIKVAAVCQQP